MHTKETQWGGGVDWPIIHWKRPDVCTDSCRWYRVYRGYRGYWRGVTGVTYKFSIKYSHQMSVLKALGDIGYTGDIGVIDEELQVLQVKC